MKLLCLWPGSTLYGAGTHMLRVAKGLSGGGWKICVSFPWTPEAAATIKECESTGITYSDLSGSAMRSGFRRTHGTGSVLGASLRSALSRSSSTLNVFRQVLVYLRARRLLDRADPDVVFVTLGEVSDTPALVGACAIAGVPTLIVVQRSSYPERLPAPIRLLYRRWARRTQRWAAVSRQNRNMLSKSLGCNSRSLTLLINGIEPHYGGLGKPSHNRTKCRLRLCGELGLPPDSIIVLTVGRVSTQKGADLLPEVAVRVIPEDPRVRFLWIGDGPSLSHLTRVIEDRGLGDHVKLPGFREDIASVYEGCNLFLFPSRTEGGCSSAIREAMLSGLPIVTTNAGGIPEVLTDQIHAHVVPVDDISGMAEALLATIREPTESSRMAERARARIMDFPVHRMVSDYENALLRLRNRVDRASEGPETSQ
jgi:glycosyltransferase involved in cell wall biosynthesis